MQPQKNQLQQKEKHHTSYEVQCFFVEITGPILITVTLLRSMHGALPAELGPHSFGSNKKAPHISVRCLFFLVEITGIEPVTSCMPCKRSPS